MTLTLSPPPKNSYPLRPWQIARGETIWVWIPLLVSGACGDRKVADFGCWRNFSRPNGHPGGENWAGTARFLLHLWCILTAAFSVLSAGMHALVCIIVISWHGAIFCEYVDLNFGHQPLKKPLGPQSAKFLTNTQREGSPSIFQNPFNRSLSGKRGRDSSPCKKDFPA